MEITEEKIDTPNVGAALPPADAHPKKVKPNWALKRRHPVVITLVIAVAFILQAFVITFVGFAIYVHIPLTAERGGFHLSFIIHNFDDEQYRMGHTIEMVNDTKRILVLTDMHYLGFPIFVDNVTDRRVRAMVEKIDPELIFVLGDNLSTFFNHWAQRHFIRKMDGFGIPWAPIFGNHDANGKATVEWLAQAFYRYSEHSLFMWGPNNLGVPGNYFINIINEGDLVHTFFMISSKETAKLRTNYRPYTLEQIQWYEWVLNGLARQAGRPVHEINSSIMLHIALPIFQDAWNNATENDEVISGDNRAGFWTPEHDNGFFERIYELGSTRNIIAGHDHSNDFIVKYRGITMGTVLRCSGNIILFGAPGTTNGGMVITVNRDGSTELQSVTL